MFVIVVVVVVVAVVDRDIAFRCGAGFSVMIGLNSFCCCCCCCYKSRSEASAGTEEEGVTSSMVPISTVAAFSFVRISASAFSFPKNFHCCGNFVCR